MRQDGQTAHRAGRAAPPHSHAHSAHDLDGWQAAGWLLLVVLGGGGSIVGMSSVPFRSGLVPVIAALVIAGVYALALRALRAQRPQTLLLRAWGLAWGGYLASFSIARGVSAALG